MNRKQLIKLIETGENTSIEFKQKFSEHEKIAKEIKQGMLEEMQPENAWSISLDWNPDGEVDLMKRLKVKLRRIVPKSIL